MEKEELEGKWRAKEEVGGKWMEKEEVEGKWRQRKNWRASGGQRKKWRASGGWWLGVATKKEKKRWRKKRKQATREGQTGEIVS